MNRGLHLVAGALGLVFLLIGLGWWVVPSVVGPQLGMTLLEGVGLSTQIADLASFFLTLGGCILVGLSTGRRVWLYPPVMLLALSAFGRTLAWWFHDAALAYDIIAFEATSAALLFYVSGTLTEPNEA